MISQSFIEPLPVSSPDEFPTQRNLLFCEALTNPDPPNAISNALGYAERYSRSHDAVIRVYDHAGNVIVSR